MISHASKKRFDAEVAKYPADQTHGYGVFCFGGRKASKLTLNKKKPRRRGLSRRATCMFSGNSNIPALLKCRHVFSFLSIKSSYVADVPAIRVTQRPMLRLLERQWFDPEFFEAAVFLRGDEFAFKQEILPLSCSVQAFRRHPDGPA